MRMRVTYVTFVLRLMAAFPVPSSSSGPRDEPEATEVPGERVEIPTILNTLKCPKLSDLTRKRKVDCNPPPKGKRRACGEGANEPKTVTATQRVKEFPGECLATAGKGSNKLFCTACREELSIKKNVIVSHVSKHHYRII